MLFTWLILAGGAAAQEPEEPTVFGEEIDVRVINLEVVVTDRAGEVVPGMSAGDFQLLVDGKEMPIDYFSAIRDRVAVAGALTAGQTPMVEAGGKVGTSYLLFVDNYFGIGRDRDRVLGKMRQDLTDFDPADRMAIVAFDGRRLERVGGWTGSATELATNLDKAMSMKAFGLQRLGELSRFEGQNNFQSADLIEGSTAAVFEDYTRTLSEQVRRVLAAATTALRTFANPPGRKVMLLSSGGWPRDPRVFAIGDSIESKRWSSLYSPKEAFDTLSNTANLLGYTLYPIDLPGLRTRGGGGSDERLSDRVADAGDFGSSAIGRKNTGAGRENETEATLMMLARDTGGKALLNGFRDIAFNAVRQDVATYYWLGFTPGRARDDREHSVEVRTRHPGLEVRSRKGYKDLSRRTEVTMRVESELLFVSDLTIGSSLDVSLGEIKKGRGKGVRQPVVLKVPLDQIVMLPTRKGFQANLELRVATVAANGERSEIPVIPIRFGGPEPPRPGQHITYETTLQLRRKKQRLVLALYDLAGEALLTARIDFDPSRRQ